MNIVCPKSQKICWFGCAETCQAPSINPAATVIPDGQETPFAGILATVGKITNVVGLESTDDDGVMPAIDKLTLSVKL